MRQDFCSFIGRCFLELNPQTKLLMNWHVEVLATKLEQCRQGKIRRLIINIPPRHLKSLCASVAFPAWLLGHDPTAQIICVSYGQELADKLARDCRAVITSPWYQRLFPTRLAVHKQAVQEFVTTKQGFRLATSVGGALTGRGADYIIIDDPLKPEEALSESQRRAVNNWYDHTLYSRINDKQKGCIIIIMQRLHQDDLVGHAREQDGWEEVRFPAIAESIEEHRVETPLGPARFTRQAGEALHPERESRETLERIRRTIGEYNFAGQYQQAPAPLGGGMVKESWFRRYTSDAVPETFDQIIQSWETANKPTELSDYSVCTTWGLKDQHFFLLNLRRRRMAYPELKRAAWELYKAYRPSVILIEDKASGSQLIKELIEEGVHGVERFNPECDKVKRLDAQTATIENGLVYLPEQAGWLADYIQEMITFPHAKYDDQVDSTSQALAWAKQRPAGWGVLEHMRRMVEKENGRAMGFPVTLKVPRVGITLVQTKSGQQLMVRPDLTIEVNEEDARPLLAAGFQKIGRRVPGITG